MNLGRLLTLERYRRALERLSRREGVRLLHPYLELVPFLALRPLEGVPWVVPVVDHLPKYFDGRSLDSRLLRRASLLSERVDCLYRWIADRMEDMGVPADRLNNPAWNTVNHEAFHPEPKELLVSYAARTIDWKNPLLMVSVIDHVFRRRPDVRFQVLGTGKLAAETAERIRSARWANQVQASYREDPSPVVNRSLVHVSLDHFDNFPNQSMLEGMAAGCAIVASNVGETHRVVTPDVGVLTSLEPEDIAQAILRLVSDPPKAEDMGHAGRARILENHHVDRYVEYLHRVHDLGRPGRVIDGVSVDDEATGG